MQIRIFKLDTFTDQIFSGNAAAVCPLDSWLPDELMLKIAAENNLSETAFFVGADGNYDLRWFTPTTEVDLCGHATLASAFIIMQELEPHVSETVFQTRSGKLSVVANETGLVMNFPAQPPETVDAPENLLNGINIGPVEVLASEDYFLVYKSQSDVLSIFPNYELLKEIPRRGVIVTAPGLESDFVSRFFGPKVGVNEDPVTGSAHCALAPYWSEKLKKKTLTAKQVSRRGGSLVCSVEGSRVFLAGNCVKYLEGVVYVPVGA